MANENNMSPELKELLTLIRGEGKFSILGKGISTYPTACDDNNQKINSACLELEQRNLIYRHINEVNHICWMPKLGNETILFLGPEDSPLLIWLINYEETVIHTFNKIMPDFIDNNNVTWLISYGYRHILTKEVLDKLPDKAINLHISYLPFNRGADPNFWSFMDNTPKGVTIHYIDTGIDTGDIIVQKQVVFESEYTLAMTYQRLQTELQELFKENWTSIKAGTCNRVKQSHKAADKNIVSQLLRSAWDTNVSVVNKF